MDNTQNITVSLSTDHRWLFIESDSSGAKIMVAVNEVSKLVHLLTRQAAKAMDTSPVTETSNA